MKVLLALVFFPLIFALIGSLGFMYIVGAIIGTAIVVALGSIKRK